MESHLISSATTKDVKSTLLEKLTDAQQDAVRSSKRRVLVVAGAGSGKTEVMARRIAWWVSMEGVSKDQIVAFTFTERAAEEMKFRIRTWIQKITPENEEASLGDMYVGTIHGFCLAKLREYWPDEYGRGVHNLMRAVHSDPKKWAMLAKTPSVLKSELQKLIDRGLFYLRYTTGDPADNMRAKGIRIIADYIQKYAEELQSLTFEPEKAFETLIQYPDGEGGALVSGAIDLVRQDDPPRVTLIDFKSGDQRADAKKLDEEEMRMQVGLYALAARTELEYEPERGLVRYLDPDQESNSQLDVPLDREALSQARNLVGSTAMAIRNREFVKGPRRSGEGEARCRNCDFLGFCGMKEALVCKTH